MRLLRLIALTFFLVTSSAHATSWTFLVYMEVEDALLHWAVRSINQMAAASAHQNVNILVHLHAKGDKAWRYHIKPRHINVQPPATITHDHEQDLVDAMQWAKDLCPASNYGLILWCSGFGILDPVYSNSHEFPWQAESEMQKKCCQLKGFLFDFEHKTYLNNAMMVSALQRIHTMLGKKLNIFGGDCCKMAMFEIGYQIKDFAQCLIGSQNCELEDSWDYTAMFRTIRPQHTTAQVARIIVDTYDAYYKEHLQKGLYTLSAVDLTYVDPITQNLGQVCDICIHDPSLKNAILNARSRCVTICGSPYYTDLDSFYTELAKETEDPILLNILAQGKALIQEAVIANSVGENIPRARGISIYFPQTRIDASYVNTSFAQETPWMSFLKKLI